MSRSPIDPTRGFEDLGRKHFPHWIAVGIALGKAKTTLFAGILAVLHLRGVEISDDAHERLRSCESLDQLVAWLHKAPMAKSTDELFAEGD